MNNHKQTLDPAAVKMLKELGIAWSLSSVPYNCPLESRILPLGTSASTDDDKPERKVGADGPQYV